MATSSEHAAGRLFFILGRGRSGTTLLSRMLIAHPEVVVAPEGFFAMSLERRYATGPWHRERARAFCQDVVSEARMRRWQLDVTRLEEKLVAEMRRLGPALDYPRVCSLVYAAYAEAIGRDRVSCFGDKNPHYALLASRLTTAFPEAKFLHVTRDPRDNVCSYRRVRFDLDQVDALAERWRRYNDAILRARDAAPDRFLHLRYEDLLAAPQRELTRVCTFLGIAFAPRMLRFQEADAREFYGARSREVPALRQPLDPARTGRWRDELAPATEQRVASLCGSLAHDLGYDLRAPGPTPLADMPQLAFGRLVGWGSVAAERRFFDTIPAPLRSRLLNAYRRSLGRS